MRAAVYRRYGPPEVVEITELATPTPRGDEVLVKVRATTVTSGDWRLRAASVPPGFAILIRLAFGIFKPRKATLGMELAGDVVSVGKAVSRLKVGDKVFAISSGLGCHAEYRVIRQDAAVALMPSNLSYEEAAPLSFGGTTALYFLRDQGQIRAGERVLINGASGGVGSAAIQLARHFGAEVTAVCSAGNEHMVRSLGAKYVIDYAREDFTRAGKTYDIILDAVGNCSFATVKPALAPGGRLLLVVASLGQAISAVVRPSRSGRKVLGGVVPERALDLRVLAELAEAGTFKPVIDHIYPFERIVDAHARVETHRKRGNVVVTLG